MVRQTPDLPDPVLHLCDLLLHIGATPDHIAGSMHVLSAGPVKLNPSTQEYVATEPNVVTGCETVPFSGSSSCPQSITVEEGERWMNIAT